MNSDNRPTGNMMPTNMNQQETGAPKPPNTSKGKTGPNVKNEQSRSSLSQVPQASTPFVNGEAHNNNDDNNNQRMSINETILNM